VILQLGLQEQLICPAGWPAQPFLKHNTHTHNTLQPPRDELRLCKQAHGNGLPIVIINIIIILIFIFFGQVMTLTLAPEESRPSGRCARNGAHRRKVKTRCGSGSAGRSHCEPVMEMVLDDVVYSPERTRPVPAACMRVKYANSTQGLVARVQ